MNKTINILVTGSNGQLGQSLRTVVSGSNDKYFFTDIDQLDITDKQAVINFIETNDIEVVVNCAAFTDVESAEDNYEAAELLNSEAVRNLADAIKSKKGWLIHISTDYVFGGNRKNTPYRENEPVNPTGVYGLTKLHGEEQIIASGVQHIIIRTAWLYSEFGNNFVKTMLRLMKEKSEIKVVFDQCGTPTYARDLALIINKIISERKFEGNEGVYNFSNEGVCSWYDFAQIISKYVIDSSCKINPCHSHEFPTKVIRPAYSVLDKTKIKKTFRIEIPYWIDSLNKCITNLLK